MIDKVAATQTTLRATLWFRGDRPTPLPMRLTAANFLAKVHPSAPVGSRASPA
jgi:hypothetical protein